MSLLVLFDVDGTLFLAHDPLMGEATFSGIEAVWGIRPPSDAISRVDHPGQTVSWITREVLRNEGLVDAEIDTGLGRFCEEISRRYLDLLAGADTRHWRSPDGTAEALAQIEHRALLTGNPEPVARARMERLELAELFPAGQGAFGCEAEERPALIELARRRAGDWPAERTVAVGDTPADVAGARAAGVRVVAFLSGRWKRDELADADEVIERMDALPDALAALGTSAAP